MNKIDKKLKEIIEQKINILNYIFLLEKTIEQLKNLNSISKYNCIFCKECIFHVLNKKEYSNKCAYCFNKFNEVFTICKYFDNSTKYILNNRKYVILILKDILNKKNDKIKNLRNIKNKDKRKIKKYIFCKYCLEKIKNDDILNKNNIFINKYNEKVCFNCLTI